MKTLTVSLSVAALLGLFTITEQTTYGQVSSDTQTTTTTVSSTGTVSDFSPNAIAVKINTSPAPVHYTFTKSTTYVDENGNPVSVETVRAGAPVTVYYEKNGDNFVADKVVVKKTVTTTTDTPAPAPAPAPAAASSAPPSIDGTVAEADSDDISIRTATSDGKLHYKAHDSTAYVDESGNPVSRSTLKEGTPVTIFYERDGDNMRATRVVVRNPAPPPVQQTTTTTQESTTTVPK